jgi:hypothetical protein
MTFSPRSQPRRSSASAKQPRSRFAPRPFEVDTDTEQAETDFSKIQPQLNSQSTVNFATMPLYPPVQAKLTIGEPGDKYEQEADRTAAEVMRMPDPAPSVQQSPTEEEEALQTKSIDISSVNSASLQQKCSECEQEVQRSALLSRRESGNDTAEAGSDIESQLNRSKGGGSPLSDEVRSFMEPRFGADFSQVRTHTGGAAVQMSEAIGAHAFTHGNDIYFGAGKSPANSDLTAHELTHVVQQTGGAQIKRDFEQTTLGLSYLAGHRDNQLGREESNRKPVARATIQRQVTVNPGGPDPCLELIQQIIEFLEELARRINDALDDPHELFKYHRKISDAHPDYGSWDGHRDRYYYDRDRLRQKIAEWESNDDCKGYPLTQKQQYELTEAEEFKEKDFPEKPAPVMYEQKEEAPAPRSTLDEIKEFARRVVETGVDAEQAAEQFFVEHPGIAWTVLGLGAVGIIALVADDVTIAGIADDVLVPVIATLMRVAWRFAI